jgi:hypothetical protein
MMRPFNFGFRLVALAILAGAIGTARPAFAADRISALVSVTNAAGTTNGQTITLNGDARTWTNNVVVAATQVLTNATPSGAKTNLYAQIGLNPFVSGQVQIVDAGSTNFQLIGNSGAILTVTLSAGWGTVSYSTQTVSTAVGVRVPVTAEVAAQQTNISSGLMAAIRSTADTNQFYESDFQMANLMGLTNAQTATGKKTFQGGANINGGGFTNGIFVNPITTNLVNYGNAVSSPGSGANSQQFGASASASGTFSLAVGQNAVASGQDTVAIGINAHASIVGVGDSSLAVGSSAVSTADASTAIGNDSAANGVNSVALGFNAIANEVGGVALGRNALVLSGHTNSVALGWNSATTATNQIMLGNDLAPSPDVVIPGSLSVTGAVAAVGPVAIKSTLTATNGFLQNVTNVQPVSVAATFQNTNSFPAGSAISFGRFAISSLANGNNAGVVVGTNVVCDLSGPTGAFTINGMVPVYAGQLVILVNRTGFNLTIANQSGVDATAANRIICLTGADKTVTGNSAAELWYDSNSSRWILLYFGQ